MRSSVTQSCGSDVHCSRACIALSIDRRTLVIVCRKKRKSIVTRCASDATSMMPSTSACDMSDASRSMTLAALLDRSSRLSLTQTNS